MTYDTLSTPAPELDAMLVGDAMHSGVLTCTTDTPLRDLARIMARYRVDAVVAIGGHTVNVVAALTRSSSPLGAR